MKRVVLVCTVVQYASYAWFAHSAALQVPRHTIEHHEYCLQDVLLRDNSDGSETYVTRERGLVVGQLWSTIREKKFSKGAQSHLTYELIVSQGRLSLPEELRYL